MRNRVDTEVCEDAIRIEACLNETLRDRALPLELSQIRSVQIDIRERYSIDIAAIHGRHILESTHIIHAKEASRKALRVRREAVKR